jgi:hypothetical protein
MSFRDVKTSWKMFMGTVFYFIWFGMFFRLSPIFAFAYIFYPLLENVLLLACIQWCWHGFLDPKNPENPYVGSITVLKGPINVLGEDFHVVHHQYPGAHWTTHQTRYEVFLVACLSTSFSLVYFFFGLETFARICEIQGCCL